MQIKTWRVKMNLSQEEAAKLLFMDVRTLQRKERTENDDPALTCIMNYQEIIAQPTIDKAKAIMNRHYRESRNVLFDFRPSVLKRKRNIKKIKGDHWE